MLHLFLARLFKSSVSTCSSNGRMWLIVFVSEGMRGSPSGPSWCISWSWVWGCSCCFPLTGQLRSDVSTENQLSCPPPPPPRGGRWLSRRAFPVFDPSKKWVVSKGIWGTSKWCFHVRTGLICLVQDALFLPIWVKHSLWFKDELIRFRSKVKVKVKVTSERPFCLLNVLS